MASMKKVMKYRWQPRNGCDCRSVKNLITTIQINFVLILSEAGMRQHKFTWIVIIKFFFHWPKITAISLPPPVFHNFFMLDILHRTAPFFTAWLFWVDIIYLHGTLSLYLLQVYVSLLKLSSIFRNVNSLYIE